MKISDLMRFGRILAAALLTGCGGAGGSHFVVTDPIIQDNGQSSIRNVNVSLANILLIAKTVRAKHRAVFSHPIRPDCCAHIKTLFVSDTSGGIYPYYTGAVQVYEYPSGTYIGALPEPPEVFDVPQGECVDKHGNVFITNTGASTIDEYSHDGVFVQALIDPNEYPTDCSINNKTGDLAVSNIVTTSNNQGGISIYSSATGMPAIYTDPSLNLYRAFFLGYNDRGKLWVDGLNLLGYFTYASFDGGKFRNVHIKGATIGFPGAVQWSGNAMSMNVGDQNTPNAPTFYHVSPNGTVTGSTVTTCPQPPCDIVQAWIKGSRLTGPDASAVTANIFPYPGGGAAETIINSNLVQPNGSAVSPGSP